MLEYINSNISIFQSLKKMWKERCKNRDNLLELQQSKHHFRTKTFQELQNLLLLVGKQIMLLAMLL